MNTKERLRFLSLLGEALHAWLHHTHRLHWLKTRAFVPNVCAELDEIMESEQPNLYQTLRDLTDADLEYIWGYAASHSVVHDIAHLRPTTR